MVKNTGLEKSRRKEKNFSRQSKRSKREESRRRRRKQSGGVTWEDIIASARRRAKTPPVIDLASDTDMEEERKKKRNEVESRDVIESSDSSDSLFEPVLVKKKNGTRPKNKGENKDNGHVSSSTSGNISDHKEHSESEKDEARDSDSSWKTFFDPRKKVVAPLPEDDSDEGVHGKDSQSEGSSVMEVDQPESPQPSTSKACDRSNSTNGKRPKSLKRKKTDNKPKLRSNNLRRLSESDNEDTSDQSSESGSDVPSKRARNSKIRRDKGTAKKDTPSKNTRASGNHKISGNNKKKESKAKEKFGNKSKSKRKERKDDLDKTNGSNVSPIRRSKRTTKEDEAKQKKKAAFEQLIKKREKQAMKPKRESPCPSRNQGSEKESDQSDTDSSYTSGPSPVPIVSDTDAESDFDGSTPSSSSVTSSGEVEEEPDLESGSEGEKQLSHQSSSDDEAKNKNESEDEKSYSSSDNETPDDGENDPRCILCKNLGRGDFRGRSHMRSSSTWCKCEECRIFTYLVGDYDLVCCKEIKSVREFLKEELDDPNICITKHPRFDLDVLKNEAYARSITKHSAGYRWWGWQEYSDRYVGGRGDTGVSKSVKESFLRSPPFQKYWKSISSYTYWLYDKLGQQDYRQIVIPACVQTRVRQEFSIQSQIFQPFRPIKICPNEHHCKLASVG